MTTIIIATDYRQSRHVAQHIALLGDWSWSGSIGASSPVPRLSLHETSWTTADLALIHLQGRRPERIIIVDYTRWRSHRPGHLAALWRYIKFLKAEGTEVVWW